MSHQVELFFNFLVTHDTVNLQNCLYRIDGCTYSTSICIFALIASTQGMKVGGKRTIKIPPNKAYGDQWYKGTIPPNAHLQFECELLNIAETPQEEFMEELNKFGIGRAVGITLCVGYLAVSPFL